jgi:hypothetical protein
VGLLLNYLLAQSGKASPRKTARTSKARPRK